MLLIGEGPGENEDLQGEPFVGRGGKLLDQYLAVVDLERGKNIYIANMVKCRPPKNRDPLPAEQEACPELRPAFVAGRWAAKEAAVKALGCGFSLGIGPRHIEILPTPTGKPELRFTGPALERARQLGVRHIHVSITHERTTAAAVVVLEA